MKKIFLMAAAVLGVFAFSAQAQNITPNGRVLAGDNNKMYQPQLFTDYAFEGILLDIPQQTRVDSLNAALADRVNGQCEKAQCGQQCDKAKCDKDKCDKAKCDKDKCDKAKCDKAKCDKSKCDKSKCDKEKCHKGQGNKAPKGQNNLRGPQMRERSARPDMEARTEYIGKVKEILTPEQYTQFLENIVLMPQKTGMYPNSQLRRDRGINQRMERNCQMGEKGQCPKAKAEK